MARALVWMVLLWAVPLQAGEAQVTKVRGASLSIDMGTEAGLVPGMRVTLVRPLYTHPLSGDTLGAETEIGTGEITKVSDRAAVVRVGVGLLMPMRPGDVVRFVTTEERQQLKTDTSGLARDLKSIQGTIRTLENTMQRGQEVKTYKGTSPPGELHIRFLDTTLLLSARLEDTNGNQALDAEEKAKVILTVSNQGPGKAYRVEVRGNLQGAPAHITGGLLEEKLETLESGENATVTCALSADEYLADGKTTLHFEAEDVYGHSAQPLELTLETRALVPPDLKVADTGIDDDDQGNSFGNANGKIEKGETIEVKAIVQNRGQGEAGNVAVELTPAEGVFFMGKRGFNLGDLGPGDYREIEFAFTVPPSYAGGTELPFKLKINEARGRYGKEEILALALNKEEKKASAVMPAQVVITGTKQGQAQIAAVPSLSVDVDENIPRARIVNRDGVAVVIGNRDYAEHNPDVGDVEFAVRDAAVMKEYLITALGYQEGNILYYPNATTAVFRRVFGTREAPEGRLAQLVKPGKSEVFVYYSGHGGPEVTEKRGYFIPVDCAPGDVRLNGYPLDLFYENLGKSEARSMTVVIDACFSGSTQQGMLLAAASPIAIVIENPAVLLKNGAVFTSSSGEEISSWYPEMKHGLFTYFFLKGLQGAADVDRNGQLSAEELHAYVSDRTEGVPYWARRLYQGRSQTPEFYGDGKRVIREGVR